MSGKNQRKDGFTVYNSYSFVDKDPIIDRFRTIVQDQKMPLTKLSELSGIGVGTFYNWLNGPTKRPQFATVVAAFRTLGYDIQITPLKSGHRTTNIVMPKLRVVSR